MARVRLELPASERFVHEITLAVRVADMNYGGHLDNSKVLSYCGEARAQMLISRGFSEMDIAGLGIVVADAVVVYKAEGFHGDRVRINVAVDEFNKYGCDLYYRLTHADQGHDIAHAKTGIVFFDYETRRPARAPDAFLTAFSSAAQ